MSPNNKPKVYESFDAKIERFKKKWEEDTKVERAYLVTLLTPFLQAMTDPDTREFERQMYCLISEVLDRKAKNWSVVQEALQKIIDDNVADGDEETAYAALYLLCTKARRENDLGVYKEKLEKNKRWASGKATYHHLKAMLLALQNELRDARHEAWRARDTINSQSKAPHIGIDHNYAEIVALLAEAEQWDPGDPSRSKDVEYALSLLSPIKDMRKPYAKFHATVGRLKVAKRDFDNAEKEVRKAIMTEANSWDSAVRRIEYKGILTRIEMERQKEALKKDLQRALEKGKRNFERYAGEAKTQHIEILGVFAGVLALILAGMAGLFQDKPSAPREGWTYAMNTGTLLMMLGGTILFTFGGLGVSVRRQGEGGRPAIVVILGLFLFVVAIFLGETLQSISGWIFADSK